MNLRTMMGLLMTSAALIAMTGCATSTEPEDQGQDQPTQQTATEKESPEERVESVSQAVTTCPSAAICARARANCANPRLGGSWCTIAQTCATCGG